MAPINFYHIPYLIIVLLSFFLIETEFIRNANIFFKAYTETIQTLSEFIFDDIFKKYQKYWRSAIFQK
jgi:hypothetical protein